MCLDQDPEYADVPLSSLAVFTGVGMSITAFPVLARILTETKLISVPLGAQQSLLHIDSIALQLYWK